MPKFKISQHKSRINFYFQVLKVEKKLISHPVSPKKKVSWLSDCKNWNFLALKVSKLNFSYAPKFWKFSHCASSWLIINHYYYHVTISYYFGTSWCHQWFIGMDGGRRKSRRNNKLCNEDLDLLIKPDVSFRTCIAYTVELHIT